MKAWELLADDTIHHLIQQRTGGSTLARAKGDVVRGAIRRLQDKYGMRFSQATGERGVIRGDTALSNFAHKADDRATGLERASGIGKNPNVSTTAHRLGTAGYAKNLTAAEIADEQALFEALDARIAPQLADFEVGKATDSPRVQAIRRIPGLERAYMSDNTQAEIAQMKKIARSPAIEPKILDTYKQLVVPKMTSNGVRLSFPNRLIGAGNFGMSVISEYGEAVDEITGGAISNTINKAVVNPVRKALGQEPVSYQKPDPQADVKTVKRAKTAVQRGGQISFGAGGVKFTLPEFGLSEILGFN